MKQPGSPKKSFHKSSPLRKLTEGLALGLGAALLGCLLFSTPLLDLLENRTWDLRVAAFAQPSPATPQIVEIRLDQASLDWGKRDNSWSWPWPREIYGLMLTYLQKAGAKVSVFDVIYTEPSSISVDDDQAFAKAIQANGKMVTAFFTTREKGESDRWVPGLRTPPWTFQGLDQVPAAWKSQGASFPIPEVRENAALLGTAQSTTDADGINRRNVPFMVFDGKPVPGLGVAAWLLAHPGAAVSLGGDGLRIGDTLVPLDPKGNAILRYSGKSEVYKTFTAQQVIRSELQLENGEKPDLDPALFKDKYVFFGFTAQGLYDLRPTPLDSYTPGVEIHMAMLDNLLSGGFMRQVPSGFSIAWILLLALGAAVTIRMVPNGFMTFAGFAVFLALPVAAAWLLYPAGWWVPAVAPLAAVLLALMAALIFNYLREGRDKKFIKDAFSQYLSPVVIDRLVHTPELLVLGGEKRTLSILFSDVQGFTSISEKLSPEDLTALLNTYLSEMTSIIYEYGGTIDKYEGDAIIAFWNAPLDLPDHAEKAVRACLAYQKRLAEMGEQLSKMSGGRKVVARIGLNTGPVVIGNMGSTQRFNYTFFGDAGNLASRLEGMNKQFGTFFMVSQFTKDSVGETPDLCFRELSSVAVVGKSEPVVVYEPMFRTEWEARAELFQRFDEGLKLYYQGDFAAALRIMEALADQDPPAAKYVVKLKELIENPPADWKGVWVSTEK